MIKQQQIYHAGKRSLCTFQRDTSNTWSWLITGLLVNGLPLIHFTHYRPLGAGKIALNAIRNLGVILDIADCCNNFSRRAIVAVETIPLSNQLFQASPLLHLASQPRHLLLHHLLLPPRFPGPPRLLLALVLLRLLSGNTLGLPLSLLPLPLSVTPGPGLLHL